MRPTIRRGIQVGSVTVRHGARALIRAYSVRRRGREAQAEMVARELRRALEELGPMYMKLGQVLSTRPDLVPPAFERELSRLQDRAPQVPFPTIKRTIERALGRRSGEAYATLDRVPLAAASIGQVHAAVLPDGSDVVVKVRRPGVVDDIELDLRVLAAAARVGQRLRGGRRYDPVGLVAEFAHTLRGELDYEGEGRNAEQVADELVAETDVQVPRIHWSHTRVEVLTETRIRGTKIDDVAMLDVEGIDRVGVAARFADAYLTMVFVHGFFHADPHPGNVFVAEDGRIGFVDFGMVGTVDPGAAQSLGMVLLALAAQDSAQMARALLGLGIAADDVERNSLERDLDGLLTRYSDRPLQDLHLGPLLVDVMGIVRRQRLRLPTDLALLIKTVMMCEGVAAQLDPGFELIPMLMPYAARLVAPPEDGTL